jgi:shikimate dehydrogenase
VTVGPEAVRRAAVLGHPVAHSLSPVLHAAAYAYLGLSWSYTAVDVDEEALPGFLAGLGPEWVGLSLTMPLKRAVLPLLSSLDEVAELVGAANTVLLSPGGRRGANTDVPGMISALQESGVDAADEATVLGGGATACSALAALSGVGVRQVQAFVRRPDDAGDLRTVAERLALDLSVAPWADAQQGLVSGLVVSTVPAGVADDLRHAVPPMPGTLFDVVYDPWPTGLAAQWTVRAGTVVSGHDLLVHQAALQVELMTGRAVPVRVLRDALSTS